MHLPEDAVRAAALASVCETLAEEQPGLAGLEAAIDELYDFLPESPLGMVEYPAKLSSLIEPLPASFC